MIVEFQQCQGPMQEILSRLLTGFKFFEKALIQPRTKAQITKNRHTTVLLYRSVARLSEHAGVLGRTQWVSEAPGRICRFPPLTFAKSDKHVKA